MISQALPSSQLLLFFINRHQKLPLTRCAAASKSIEQAPYLAMCVCVDEVDALALPHRSYKANKTQADAKRRPGETLAATPCKFFFLFPIFIASRIRFIARTRLALET